MLSFLSRAGVRESSVSDRPNGRWPLPPPVRHLLGPGRTRRRLVPYLLILPSAAAIGLLLTWPAIQLAAYSFQDYGLPQVTGASPTSWVGIGNYRLGLADTAFLAAPWSRLG